MRDLDYFAARVAYPSIFARSVDAAAKNLADLIAHRRCGLEEGTDAWRGVLDQFVRSEDALDRLEFIGETMSAPFNRAQWRDVAEKTLRLLEGAVVE